MHEAELALVIKGPAKMVKRDNWRQRRLRLHRHDRRLGARRGPPHLEGRELAGQVASTPSRPSAPASPPSTRSPTPTTSTSSSGSTASSATTTTPTTWSTGCPSSSSSPPRIMTLNSGDLIACGTNHEGLGPLQDGEVVDFEIHGIGRMRLSRARPAQAHVGEGHLHGPGLHQSRSRPAQPAARGRPARRSLMPQSSFVPDDSRRLSRRALIKTMGVAAAVAAPGLVFAQAPAGPASPPSTITTPPRDFGPGGAPTTYFTDPTSSRRPLVQRLAPAQRADQAPVDGRALVGRPGLEQPGPLPGLERHPEQPPAALAGRRRPRHRLPHPSNNSNGNTFDFQGRQLSCEHLTRRVVRYEHDGSVTLIADKYDGKRLNSPNDVVPHPDGSYWFTDPPYGGQLYEGAPDAAGGPSNRAGRLKPRLGQPLEIGDAKRELPTNVYRVDPSGRVDLVVKEDQVPDPNGLVLLAGLQEALRGQHGPGTGRHRTGRQGRDVRVRRGDRQQGLERHRIITATFAHSTER